MQEIIDSANPADSVKNNEILLEMMQEIKASEKKINQYIYVLIQNNQLKSKLIHHGTCISTK